MKLDGLLSGRFWLPKDPTRPLDGVLSLQANRLSLVLVGGFGVSHSLSDEVLFGHLPAHTPRDVTLFNVYGQCTHTMSGPAETRATSTVAVFGGHFNSLSDVTALRFDFHLPHVAMWIHDQCFDLAINFETQVATVMYKTIEERSYPLSPELRLCLTYRGGAHLNGYGIEQLLLRRQLFVGIVAEQECSFEQLREIGAQYTWFFSWLMDLPLQMEDISLMRACDAPLQKPARLPVIEDRIPEPRLEKVFSLTNCLVEFPHHRELLPQLLSGWHSLCEDHSDSIEAYFGAFMRTTGWENEFLAVTAACEELYTSGVQTELGKTLTSYCSNWAEAISRPVPSSLIERIVATRHYYAHRTSKRSKQAARDFVLKRYTEFLRALYSLELLRLLGVPRQQILDIVKSSYSLRFRLDREYFPDLPDSAEPTA